MPYFFVLCLLFLQSVALANDEWELAKQDKERNIQVYTRPQLDSPYHEFRAQTLVEQPLKTVWAVLVDINAWPQWLARIKQVKILKKNPKKHGFMWFINYHILLLSVIWCCIAMCKN
jgi:uncharacterized membrane protein